MKTLAQTIKEAIKSKGYTTVKACAQHLQIPYELLRKVVGEDHIPKDNQILVYARKLDLNPKDLLFIAYQQKAPSEFKEYFKAKKSASVKEFSLNKIPVIGWEYQEISERAEAHKEFLVTNLTRKDLFAMCVADDSMSTLFLKGEYIIVEPQTSIADRDFVIAAKEGKKAVLRMAKIFGKISYLAPLNSRYSESELTKETKIWGRVIRKQKDF